MNKKDWKYISGAMPLYAENNEWRGQRIAKLLRLLIKEVNEKKMNDFFSQVLQNIYTKLHIIFLQIFLTLCIHFLTQYQ